jgi:hypothetical protein
MGQNNHLRGALVCLVFAGVILFNSLACGMPVSSAGQTPAVRTQPPQEQTVEPTSVPVATLPPTPALPPADEVSQVQVYLVAVGDAGSSGKQIGCGDSLVPITRMVTPTRQPIAAALTELFSIKDQFLGQSGLYNAVYQSNLKVESVVVDANKVATVVISGQVMLGGECDTPRFKGQIEQTILGVGSVQSANILLNGKTIDEALSLK